MRADLSLLPTVFLTAEAVAAGLDGRRLRTALVRGEVLHLGRGVWADPGRWPAWAADRHHLLASAAVRAVPDCAMSHASAALSWGLPRPRGRLPRPCVTVEEGDRSRSPGSWMTLYRGSLSQALVTDRDGLRVTTAPRTVVDAARQLSTGDALAMADAAVRGSLTTAAALQVERRRERRWPGVTRVDQVLALLDARREGWLESWSAAAFHRMGLPPWLPQVNVFDGHGEFLGRVDGYWIGLGVVGEADGRGKYLGDHDPGLDRSPDAVARRLLAGADREVAIRATGLGLVRWSTEDITLRPLLVAARWRREVERTDSRRIRADLRCTCCNLDPTSCDLGAVHAAPLARNRT